MVFGDVLRQAGEKIGSLLESVIIHPPTGRLQFGGEMAHARINEHEFLLVVAHDLAARLRLDE